MTTIKELKQENLIEIYLNIGLKWVRRIIISPYEDFGDYIEGTFVVPQATIDHPFFASNIILYNENVNVKNVFAWDVYKNNLLYSKIINDYKIKTDFFSWIKSGVASSQNEMISKIKYNKIKDIIE